MGVARGEDTHSVCACFLTNPQHFSRSLHSGWYVSLRLRWSLEISFLNIFLDNFFKNFFLFFHISHLEKPGRLRVPSVQLPLNFVFVHQEQKKRTLLFAYVSIMVPVQRAWNPNSGGSSMLTLYRGSMTLMRNILRQNTSNVRYFLLSFRSFFLH